jgi:hypothetical protein
MLEPMLDFKIPNPFPFQQAKRREMGAIREGKGLMGSSDKELSRRRKGPNPKIKGRDDD